MKLLRDHFGSTDYVAHIVSAAKNGPFAKSALVVLTDDENRNLFEEMKKDCQDKTEYGARRRKVVLDDTAKGLLEN